MRAASRRFSSSSRATQSSRCRSVSTTSIAIMTSSSAGALAGWPGPTPMAGSAEDGTGRPVETEAGSAIDGERLALGHEARDAPLAVLDRVPDLGGVLGGELAHFADDLERAFLERDHGIDELLDRIRPDGWSVARPNRGLADLVADLGEHLEALRHALLHGLERLGGYVQPEQARERGLERGEDRVVGREERHGL